MPADLSFLKFSGDSEQDAGASSVFADYLRAIANKQLRRYKRKMTNHHKDDEQIVKAMKFVLPPQTGEEDEDIDSSRRRAMRRPVWTYGRSPSQLSCRLVWFRRVIWCEGES